MPDPEDRCPYVADADGSHRYILVVLTTRSGGEFTYKDIGETAGPVEKDCPERLLKAASPFKDGHGAFGPHGGTTAAPAHGAERQRGRTQTRPTLPHPEPVTFRDGSTPFAIHLPAVQARGRIRTVYAAWVRPFYRFRPETFGFEIVGADTNAEDAR